MDEERQKMKWEEVVWMVQQRRDQQKRDQMRRQEVPQTLEEEWEMKEQLRKSMQQGKE